MIALSKVKPSNLRPLVQGGRNLSVAAPQITRERDIYRKDLGKVGGIQGTASITREMDLTNQRLTTAGRLRAEGQLGHMSVSATVGTQISGWSGVKPVGEVTMELGANTRHGQAVISGTMDYQGNASGKVEIKGRNGNTYFLNVENISMASVPNVSVGFTPGQLSDQIKDDRAKTQGTSPMDAAREKEWERITKQLDTLRSKQILQPHEEQQFERLKQQAAQLRQEERNERRASAGVKGDFTKQDAREEEQIEQSTEQWDAHLKQEAQRKTEEKVKQANAGLGKQNPGNEENENQESEGNEIPEDTGIKEGGPQNRNNNNQSQGQTPKRDPSVPLVSVNDDDESEEESQEQELQEEQAQQVQAPRHETVAEKLHMTHPQHSDASKVDLKAGVGHKSLRDVIGKDLEASHKKLEAQMKEQMKKGPKTHVE